MSGEVLGKRGREGRRQRGVEGDGGRTLDIEVVRTEHVQGKPLPTRVESSVSVGNAAHLTASEIKSLLLRLQARQSPLFVMAAKNLGN